MTLNVIHPPAGPPVSRTEVKAHLRIGHDGEDALVDTLTGAATAHLEATTGLALVTRTLMRRFTAWPASIHGHGLALRPRPVAALNAVETQLGEAQPEALTGRFQIISGRLALRPWSFAPPLAPGTRVHVTYEAGFGTADDVPEDLKLAVKQLIAEAYGQQRTAFSGEATLSDAVARLVAPYREVRL